MKVLFAFCFFLNGVYCFSQAYKSTVDSDDMVKGYIITKENKYQQGFILFGSEIENTKYIYFKEHKNSKSKRLDKDQIISFGSSDQYYELMPYNGDSVFMQKLNHYFPAVYYLHNDTAKRFFIKTQIRFEQIPKNRDDLREFLNSEMSNCIYSLENIQQARYKKKYLQYLFKRNESCSSDRIPAFSYGIYTGIKFNKLKLNDEVVYKYGSDVYFKLEDIDYMWETGGIISVYVDVPLNAMDGKISFHPEIQYEKSTYGFKKHNPDINFGFDIHYYTANCFLRYKTLDKTKSLFADFGFCYSAIDVSNAYIDDQNLFHQLADYMIGLSVGGGVSINNRFDIGLRSNYSLSHSMPKVFSINLLLGVVL